MFNCAEREVRILRMMCLQQIAKSLQCNSHFKVYLVCSYSLELLPSSSGFIIKISLKEGFVKRRLDEVWCGWEGKLEDWGICSHEKLEKDPNKVQ